MGTGGRSKEFYEFVLPPVDICKEDGGIRVLVDMAGFAMEDMEITVIGDVLRVRAQREPAKDTITSQRPCRMDKSVRIPGGTGGAEQATYTDGVLSIFIPASGGQS